MTDLTDYTWHSPGEVLRVIDEDHDVLAYGVRYEVVSSRPVADGDADGDPPLPRPRHTDISNGECLACEWRKLKGKIEAASGGA